MGPQLGLLSLTQPLLGSAAFVPLVQGCHSQPQLLFHWSAVVLSHFVIRVSSLSGCSVQPCTVS